MKTKGWVYVITNQAMPELVKVGFSTKDPALRAKELNHTGNPHPYLVEYEALVWEPRNIEARVHTRMNGCREGKEWFKCTVEHAVVSIQSIVGSELISEQFIRADRRKADEMRAAEMRAQESKRAKQAQIDAEEARIRTLHEKRLEEHTKVESYFLYWIGSTIAVGVAIIIGAKTISDGTLFIASTFFGAIIAFLAREFHQGAKQNSETTRRLRESLEKELERARSSIQHPKVNRSAKSTLSRLRPMPPQPVARVGSKWTKTFGGLQEDGGEVFIPSAALCRIGGANPGYEVIPTCYGVCFISDKDVFLSGQVRS